MTKYGFVVELIAARGLTVMPVGTSQLILLHFDTAPPYVHDKSSIDGSLSLYIRVAVRGAAEGPSAVKYTELCITVWEDDTDTIGVCDATPYDSDDVAVISDGVAEFIEKQLMDNIGILEHILNRGPIHIFDPSNNINIVIKHQ